MKRKGLWTILLVFGFLFSIFFLFVLLVVSAGNRDMEITGVGIGVVEISGPIMESKEAIEQIERFTRNENIKGILVRVDSPGGAVAPSQEIHQAVLRARKSKKVIISMGSLAASGGYYIAVAGEKIYANPGTVTGSIGVVTQLTNVAELAEMAKIKVHTITSGDKKDSGNPFRAFTEEDRAVFEDMVMDIYDQFVKDVAKGRGMDEDEVRVLADGRVYTGRQAKEKGLVDELGGMQDAAEFLAGEVGLDTPPELIYPPKNDGDFLQTLMEGSARSVTRGVVEGARDQALPRFEYRMFGTR